MSRSDLTADVVSERARCTDRRPDQSRENIESRQQDSKDETEDQDGEH